MPSVLALDLGGTKLAIAVFSEDGALIVRESVALEQRKGDEVGDLICEQIRNHISVNHITSVGISIPGIARQKTGTVWAPNIEGWEDYPLISRASEAADDIPVSMDSDRACCIYGEQWQGNAKQCKDAIFLAVGTGIGAGILSNGVLIRGSHDIAGAVGWMVLPNPGSNRGNDGAAFELYASGNGIATYTKELLKIYPEFSVLKSIASEEISAHHVFKAYEVNDPLAVRIIDDCITFWAMASANLVSIFNPEKIIFGGGIFGPAAKFIPQIKEVAAKWAQPISIRQVSFEHSVLGPDAAVYGAGYLAAQNHLKQA